MEERKAIWGSLGTTETPRFLIYGVGAVVDKMRPSWEHFQTLGVELHAADISEQPSGRAALPEGTRFYNLKDNYQLAALVHGAWDNPFTYAYLSTVPDLHIFTALRFDFLAKSFIFPKPVDSSFSAMQTLHAEKLSNRALDVESRSCVHDHYRNKPLTAFLKGHMPDLHHRNGYLRNIRVFVTEHRTIQTEFRRRASLECGILLDLAPHALSVIYELVPEQLTWKDVEGNTFRRVKRKFDVVSVVRARDNACILHNPNSETFSALHLKVIEDVEFIPRSDPNWTDHINREFNILIVVAKGVSIQDPHDERDLKAIELEFDGQLVRGNFDTNAVYGIVDKELHSTLQKRIELRHRGLNLPLQLLADNGFMLDAPELRNGQIVQPFQEFLEAYAIAHLLEQCRTHHTASTLSNYSPRARLRDVLNRCVVRGLDARWAIEDDLSSLVFGVGPDNPIP